MLFGSSSALHFSNLFFFNITPCSSQAQQCIDVDDHAVLQIENISIQHKLHDEHQHVQEMLCDQDLIKKNPNAYLEDHPS